MNERDDERTALIGETPTLATAETATSLASASMLPTRHARSRFAAGGTIDGTYKLMRLIGHGGMGEVFIAKDMKLGRRVAIKTLRIPESAAGPQFDRLVQLFRRDATATAQLAHPNIVTVHSFGEHEDTPYMVLELIDGTPLDRLLHERGPMLERDALVVMRQVADALAAAHAQGIVHRDIKPSNLMLAADGRAVVLDFGIAMMRDAHGTLEDALEKTSEQLDEHLGKDPGSAGTMGYMAPEQLLDARRQSATVDAWAFGVTFYELLTGERPYTSSLQLDESFAPSFSEVRVSKPTRTIIAECLRVHVHERIADFTQIRDRLDAILASLTMPGAERPALRDTNLVGRDDVFVGRDEDVERLNDALLGDAPKRVVTLTGPGGVGKTRLVQHWGKRALDDERVTQIFVCDLTQATTRDGILFAIADALHIPLTGDPLGALTETLARRFDLVCILDNAERALDPLAELLDHWRTRAKNARFVLTSRAPVHTPDEFVVRLDPLDPATHSMELFVRRAQEARPGWSCPPGEEDALAKLVTELDGLPLAIELAAARIRMMRPKKMLERMSRRFDVLRSSGSGLPDHQSTLFKTLQWSWELLDEAEQSALAQLSVFEGGCTLEDAEEILELDHLDDAPFVLDALERLEGASLVRVHPETLRFTTLVSVRAFAAIKCAELDLETSTRARHAAHYAMWAHDARIEDERNQRMEHMAPEAGNFDAAAAHALTRADDHEILGSGLSCLTALTALIEFRGPFTLADELLARAEPHLGALPEHDLELLTGLSRLLMVAARIDTALELAQRALELAESLGSPFHQSRTRGLVGNVLLNAGRLDESAEHLTAALELAERVQDMRRVSNWSISLGIIARRDERIDDAQAHLERAIEAARAVGDIRREAACLSNLGTLQWDLGDLDACADYLRQAVVLVQRSGDLHHEQTARTNLGIVTYKLGDVDEARKLFTEALEIVRVLDDAKTVENLQGILAAIDRGEELMP